MAIKSTQVTPGKAARLEKKEIKTYKKYTAAKEAGNAKKSGKLYDKLVKKQTKSIMAGVNVDYSKIK